MIAVGIGLLGDIISVIVGLCTLMSCHRLAGLFLSLDTYMYIRQMDVKYVSALVSGTVTPELF